MLLYSTNEDPAVARSSHRDPSPSEEGGMAQGMVEKLSTSRSSWIQPIYCWLNEQGDQEEWTDSIDGFRNDSPFIWNVSDNDVNSLLVFFSHDMDQVKMLNMRKMTSQLLFTLMINIMYISV